MADEEKTIWVICVSCGHARRCHRILCEHQSVDTDDDGWPMSTSFHRMVQCMGCRSYKFVVTDEYDGPEGPREANFRVYPDAPGPNKRRPAATSIMQSWHADGFAVPETVRKMYKETVD